MKFFIIAAFFISLTSQFHLHEFDLQHSTIYPLRAKAVLHGSTVDPVTNESYNILGSVQFDQYVMLGNVTVTVDIFGLPPHAVSTGLWRGLHIHTYGILKVTSDIRDTCLSTGPHFNPFNETHGSPNSTYRHVADLGNVRTWENGTIRTVYNVSGLDLYGPYTIVGRSVVLHEGKDDYGLAGTDLSRASGSSGPRIACGVIGWDKTESGSVENGFLTYFMAKSHVVFNETYFEPSNWFFGFEDEDEKNSIENIHDGLFGLLNSAAERLHNKLNMSYVNFDQNDTYAVQSRNPFEKMFALKKDIFKFY